MYNVSYKEIVSVNITFLNTLAQRVIFQNL
jgi:hypothetical protein